MTEHKYTDEEVIKALECCAVDPNSGKFSDCKNCPMDDIKDANCFNWIIQQCALDLINRQKAEVAFWMDAAANAKKEAVKEFAEKLKKRERSNAFCAWCAHADIYGHRAKECDEPYIDKNGKEQKACYVYAKFESYIDGLVKEFTEEKT